MGQRRKGEQPIKREVRDWSPDMPVARAMRDGTGWFAAWLAQEATHYECIRKLTGLSPERSREIEFGSTVTPPEIEALARAWWITPEGLTASLPDPGIVVV